MIQSLQLFRQRNIKMHKIIMVLFLPLTIEARLEINITVGSNKRDVRVNTFGTDIQLVTETEAQTFNFTDTNINRGFRIELGKVPDNVFLKDPTPYENLFQEFEWEPVRRKMFIKDVRILDTVSEGVVLRKQRVVNNSTDTIRRNVSIFENVENVIYSSWSKEGVPGVDLYYDLIIYLNNNNFEYVNKWRDNQIRSRNLAVGLSEEGFIEIKPGEIVTTELSARKTIVLVEIIYAAVLTGSVIGDYDALYGKYHFYAPSVTAIMKAAKLKNEIITSELIEIRCFTSPTLDLVDGSGKKVYIIKPPVPMRYKKKKHVFK